MASLAISSVTPSYSTQSAAPAKAAPVQAENPPATLKADTVKLSVAAQAKLMHRQGQSIALIASSLGTNVASIDGYLGIKVAAQAAAATVQAAQAAPAAPQAQAAQAAQSSPAAATSGAASEAPATAAKS